MTAGRKTTIFRRLWVRLLATAGLAAAILLSWWWRIDEARSPDQVPVVALGDRIDLGRSVITPLSLRLSDHDGQLILDAVIENVTGRTQGAVFGMPEHLPQLVLDGTPIDPAEVVLTRDGETLRQLHPRMPERIALLWTLPPEWQPAEVRVDFAKQIFKLRDNLYGQSNWLGFEPAARLAALPEVQP